MTRNVVVHDTAWAGTWNATTVIDRAVEDQQASFLGRNFLHDFLLLIEEYRATIRIIDVVEQDRVGNREIDMRGVMFELGGVGENQIDPCREDFLDRKSVV